MPSDRPPRLAVLIDADNASSRIAEGLFAEITKLGEASVRRIYGNIADQRLKGWSDILTRHALDWRQQIAYTPGKNASDITLVIEAMDLLHTGRFNGFCLVSSDSDFTRLASRIREEGADVFGFGEQKTPESFRLACDRFIFTENLLPAVAIAAAPIEVQGASGPAGSAERLVKEILSEVEAEDGWVALGHLGTLIARRQPDFDPRTYHYKRLADLVAALGGIETQKVGNQVSARIAPKRTKAPAKKR